MLVVQIYSFNYSSSNPFFSTSKKVANLHDITAHVLFCLSQLDLQNGLLISYLDYFF